MRIISTYAGHESSISVYIDGKITIIELDKFTGSKYFSLNVCNVVEQSEIIEQALEAAGIENDFDIWINGSFHDKQNGLIAEEKMENIINFKKTIRGPGHHMCHAHSAYWQSPFDKAYLISSDGGGNDGYFNIYDCNRKTGPLLVEKIDRFDFGTYYALIACTIPQVGKSTKFYYDAAGKAMALASQLQIKLDPELMSAIRSFYSNGDKAQFIDYVGIQKDDFYYNLKLTKGDTEAKGFENQRLGMMVARANQKVFEEKFDNILRDRQYYVGLQQDNLILTGGTDQDFSITDGSTETFRVDTENGNTTVGGRLDINGNVINLKIHKNTLNEIAKDNKLQPYLDSAIRAIKKASPFEGLKKDRYNNWKELIINFKPIEAR